MKDIKPWTLNMLSIFVRILKRKISWINFIYFIDWPYWNEYNIVYCTDYITPKANIASYKYIVTYQSLLWKLLMLKQFNNLFIHNIWKHALLFNFQNDFAPLLNLSNFTLSISNCRIYHVITDINIDYLSYTCQAWFHDYWISFSYYAFNLFYRQTNNVKKS